MDNPLISVIIPVYNSAPFLKDSVQSILDQTYRNLEIIIIEDCSIDNSLEILRSFNDPRIILIENEANKGVGYNGNLGLEIAKGKYIVRHDSDDVSVKNRIQLQFEFLEQNKDVIVVGSDFRAVYESGKIENRIMNRNVLRTLLYCPIHQPTAMIRAGFVRKHNIKYGVLPEDFTFWNDIYKANNYLPSTFYNLSEKLLDYKIHDSQLTSTKLVYIDAQRVQLAFDYLRENVNYFERNVKTDILSKDAILGLNNAWNEIDHGYGKDEVNEVQQLFNWEMLKSFSKINLLQSLMIYRKYPLFGWIGYLRLIKRGL